MQNMPATPMTATRKTASLRQLLADSPFIVAPAVHDVFSLRLVEQAGYASACISGAMLSYALLGIPDIGLLTLTECVEHCRRLTRAAAIPITADADAGYGNARGVAYAVELFEEAGAAGVNIEDQIVPRRHGAGAVKEVVSAAEMAGKIRAGHRARRDPNFLIIARTDAYASESNEQVIERAQVYADAGADLLLPIAPRNSLELERLVRAAPLPITISAATGLHAAPSAALMSLARLRDVGVKRVSLTTLLPGGALAGMKAALDDLRVATEAVTLLDDGNPAVAGARSLEALFDARAQHAWEAELLAL
jgi:2-methylisocitrate lyase-like PEP mutase family enzyme